MMPRLTPPQLAYMGLNAANAAKWLGREEKARSRPGIISWSRRLESPHVGPWQFLSQEGGNYGTRLFSFPASSIINFTRLS